MPKQSLIQRMENKFGKYAIKHLIIYVIIAYVIGYIFVIFNSEIYNYLVLDASMVMQGQVWRLFTWICTVPASLSFWVFFVLLFCYFIGRSLEQALGAFKYNLFMFSGWFFMTIGSMIVYWVTAGINGAEYAMVLPVSTYYLNLASFLAFALLAPNVRVLLFYIIPIKIKWLAIFDVAYLIYQVVDYAIDISKINEMYQAGSINYETAYYCNSSYYAQIFSIIISLLNFIIFFFAVRKITPKNIKYKIKSEAERKQRQKEWQENWANNRKEWHENGWTDGQTKWNEKDEQEKDDNSLDLDREENGKFMGWADWYDPNETEEEREKAQAAYEDEKERERIRKEQEREEKAISRRKSKTSVYGTQTYEHRCDICGRTNISDPDLVFRYCSKCEGNHEFCQDHIFNHEHFEK